MRARRPSGVLLVVAGCSGAPDAPPVHPGPSPEAIPAELGREVAERLSREVDCDASDLAWMCAFHALPGADFELPRTPTTWVGMHYAVRRSRAFEEGFMETGRAARLTLGPEGLSLERLDRTPTLATFALASVLQRAQEVALGARPVVEVPQILADELARPLPRPPVKLRRDDEPGWVVDGERTARLWRVPATDGRPPAFVILEPVDGGDAGAIAAVFPDVAYVPLDEVPAPPPELEVVR